MKIQERFIAVKYLPEKVSAKEGRAIFLDFQASMEVDRPRIVIDCSKLRELDKPAVHLLLCCLKEVMKRNGDVKLAALPPGSAAVQERTGMARLFDIHDTADEAVESFHRLPTARGPQQDASGPQRGGDRD